MPSHSAPPNSAANPNDVNTSHANANAPVSSAPILSVQGVSVQRGEFVLCAEVAFELMAGDICHLVGENGLGKTTLLMQLVGLLPTVTGQCLFSGQELGAGAPKLLYVAHQTGLHESLTVAQNLHFLMALYGIHPDAKALEQALSAVGLAGLADIACAQLSAGQTRRVGLARLWLMDVADAPLWILDEPLTALDVAMAAQVEARLFAFAQAGGAVLVTSHQALAVANARVDLMDYAQ